MMISQSNINATSSNVVVNNNNANSNKVDSTQKTEKVSRVEELKAQIESGEYKVDIEQTASKIAESLF